MVFDNLYEHLNLHSGNGLFRKGDSFSDFPFRIKNVIDNIDFDGIFFENNKPMIIFKEFDDRTCFENEIDSFYKIIWNLGEIPVLFIELDGEYLLYNTNIFDGEEVKIWKRILNTDLIDNNLINTDLSDNNLNFVGLNRDVEFKKNNSYSSLDDFSYLNIKSGYLWNKYKKDFKKDNKVDDYLIRNLRAAKQRLLAEDLDFDIINLLIGRLIFSRFLFDRDIIDRCELK
ncbi:MAG: hypothetical protein LBM96_11880, partial [Methanobrevibacter sp.]|nr:hypothetical protein [Candidatus Methanoflexus mossambicus]